MHVLHKNKHVCDVGKTQDLAIWLLGENYYYY